MFRRYVKEQRRYLTYLVSLCTLTAASVWLYCILSLSHCHEWVLHGFFNHQLMAIIGACLILLSVLKVVGKVDVMEVLFPVPLGVYHIDSGFLT